jgi:hypothetical protein
MTAVLTPLEATSFEADLKCQSCHTTFHAARKDLQIARLKAPATYWFDGHGDAAAAQKFYVACPAAHCTNVITVDDSQIEDLLRSELKAERRLRRDLTR